MLVCFCLFESTKNLAAEREKLYDVMKREISELQDITNLKQVNKDLGNYVEALEERESLQCQEKKDNKMGVNNKVGSFTF